MAVGTIALTNGKGGVKMRSILEITTWGPEGTRFIIEDPFGQIVKSVDGFRQYRLAGEAPNLSIEDAFSMVNSGKVIVADSEERSEHSVKLDNFRFEL